MGAVSTGRPPPGRTGSRGIAWGLALLPLLELTHNVLQAPAIQQALPLTLGAFQGRQQFRAHALRRPVQAHRPIVVTMNGAAPKAGTDYRYRPRSSIISPD